jgi:hypothetical protein
MEALVAAQTHLKVSKQATPDAREKFRALFELVALGGVALFVVVVLAGVLRATEHVISTKLFIPEAHAATIETASTRDEFQAKLLLRTGKAITMSPGEEKVYTIGFKNIGTASWKNHDYGFLSIYTVDPNYRDSDFYQVSWRDTSQPTVLKDRNVPPGYVGFFEFFLKAPQVPGIYKEAFHLAAEDRLWLPGGGFEIEITVTDSAPTPVVSVAPAPAVTPAPTPTALAPEPAVVTEASQATASATGYGATLLLRSHKKAVELGPNETVDMIFAFKNSGTEKWSSQSLRAPTITIASNHPSFRHLSWASSNEVVQSNDTVLPGQLAFFNFTLQAPNSKGSYEPSFRLVVDDVMVPGGEIQIPITVTADGPSSSLSVPAPAIDVIPEPVMRIGLFETERPIMVTANGTYNVMQGTEVVEVVAGGQPSKVTFDFDYKTYTVTNSNGTNVYRKPVRFMTQDQTNGFFTLPSYHHPPGWNKSLNDNMFRQSIEIYLAANTGNLWVINEIPMSMYLYGLAETSNPTEPEFQKALATAARTYAFYHWSRNSKHGGHFHVDAHFDQVYRGYGSEIRMPQWVDSINASRGAIALYAGNIAITPYYSRSDGRTRDWTEVWGGGPKPWLKSVRTEYDEGRTLWGHGVGMSARDALLRTRNEGTSWQDLVKYYYTGVDIVQKWQ